MSTLAKPVANVYAVRDLSYSDRIHSICRFVELPRGRSVAPKVVAIQKHFWSETGRELPMADAIRELDRIVAERDDVPFPAAYSRIADFLVRNDYDLEVCHEVVGHLRRGGTVATCPCLEPADRAAVSDLLPRTAAPCRTAD